MPRSPHVFWGFSVPEDPDVGVWIGVRLDDSRSVRGVVPGGFEAYAVIFHPAYRETAEGEPSSLFAPWHLSAGPGASDRRVVFHREVRWAEVAAANGRVAHPRMEWAAITGHWSFRTGGGQPGIWDIGPQHGSLPLRPTIRLCQLLSQFTGTPGRCFFGISSIYGDLPKALRQAPAAPTGEYLLTGPLLALPAASFEWPPDPFRHRSANLWWPDDRAWCLVSNYDYQETYIGASRYCIERLVADSELEAMRVDPDQPLDDTINPEPLGVYEG